MKPLSVFLLIFVFVATLSLSTQASSLSCCVKATEQNGIHSPQPLKNKVKRTKELKKIKKVQSHTVGGVIIFTLGCMIMLLGLGISIVAIMDAVLGIGLGVLALGFILMCIGDIIGNLGLMGLILDLCDCFSVLL